MTFSTEAPGHASQAPGHWPEDPVPQQPAPTAMQGVSTPPGRRVPPWVSYRDGGCRVLPTTIARRTLATRIARRSCEPRLIDADVAPPVVSALMQLERASKCRCGTDHGLRAIARQFLRDRRACPLCWDRNRYLDQALAGRRHPRRRSNHQHRRAAPRASSRQGPVR